MSTLRRWVEEEATATELRLLEASRRERPDSQARLRTLLALGVGGPASGAPPSGGASSAWRGWRAGTTTKIAILAVCGGGAITAAAWFALGHRTAVATATATATALPAPSVAALPPIEPVAPRAVEATPIDPAKAGATDGARERPPRATRRHSIRPAPSPLPRPSETTDLAEPSPPAAESTLSAEVAALESAHAALAAHDGLGALRALDEYLATFPSGRLASEQTVLRVQALLAQGDDGAASVVAEHFFAAHPDSSYVSRVRDLLHDAKEHQKKK